jgi:hypothetical protein
VAIVRFNKNKQLFGMVKQVAGHVNRQHLLAGGVRMIPFGVDTSVEGREIQADCALTTSQRRSNLQRCCGDSRIRPRQLQNIDAAEMRETALPSQFRKSSVLRVALAPEQQLRCSQSIGLVPTRAAGCITQPLSRARSGSLGAERDRSGLCNVHQRSSSMVTG